MTTTRGVKKVNENILSPGRAIIVTEKDVNQYKWSEIPVGSKFIDTKTGIEMVKLEGESTWVPAGIKNDGTLCIAKDTRRTTEIYTIVNPNEGNGLFSCVNENGQTRHFQKTNQGFVFKIEKGSYQKDRNHLSVVIDDVLHRTASSGGIIEVNETTFILTDPLVAGQEITIVYDDILRIGNPYPRIFINKKEPEKAEIGDLWIDEDGTLDDLDNEKNEITESTKFSWDRITDTPTTLAGYGIKTQYSEVGHSHAWLDIRDRPQSMTANGGNADTVGGHAPGSGANNIPVLDSAGCISANMLPTQYLLKSGACYIQDNRPAVVKDKSIWICTKKDDAHIEVYSNNAWLRLGK